MREHKMFTYWSPRCIDLNDPWGQIHLPCLPLGMGCGNQGKLNQLQISASNVRFWASFELLSGAFLDSMLPNHKWLQATGAHFHHYCHITTVTANYPRIAHPLFLPLYNHGVLPWFMSSNVLPHMPLNCWIISWAFEIVILSSAMFPIKITRWRPNGAVRAQLWTTHGWRHHGWAPESCEGSCAGLRF